MRITKLFITAALLIFCSLYCRAQETDYVYADSSVLLADSLSAKALVFDMKKKGRLQEKMVVDSAVRKSQLLVINDSAEGLKNAAAFDYAKNLDSLLKELQKAQHTEQQPSSVNLSWLERFFFSPVTKVFFWMLACLFIGFILYKLFFTKGIFQRPTVTSNVTHIPLDAEEHMLAGTDYNKLIAQAITAQNYRLATRYHYLQVLQKLSQKNAIQFAPEKTNYQYVAELSGKPYRVEFASLTLSYEYAWYGGFEVTEGMFATIQNSFKQFNSQLQLF
jgi:hypothetical protein